MVNHEHIAFETKMDIYFATKGARGNEAATRTPTACCGSTCRRGTDLSQFTQHALDAIADRLTGRPRQTLGWKTPAQALDAVLP